MIFTRRGIDIDAYPAVRTHLNRFRSQLEPQPDNWNGGKWPGRKSGTYRWYEIQDNTAYFAAFQESKIIYQEIQYYPAYSLDTEQRFLNNKCFLIRSADPWLLAVLNSPLLWWFGWRHFGRMKDEALTPQGYRLETLPIAPVDANAAGTVAEAVDTLYKIQRERQATRHALRDWLRLTWELPSPPGVLVDPYDLTADQLVSALRAALPARRRNLSAAAIGAIRAEHAATIAPMATRLAEATRREMTLSALVNRAYGLSLEEEALLWETSPPRMPIAPPQIRTANAVQS